MLHATPGQILWSCGRGAHFRSTGIFGKTGKSWLIGLLAGAAVYAFAGFLVAPRVIQLWIENPNLSGPGCRLSVQEVYVNPFTMFLSLSDATLFEQESKSLISATVAETRIWSIDRLRTGTPGRDVTIRNLVVTNTDNGERLLAVPDAFLGDLEIGARSGLIHTAHARLERPDAAITRDVGGIRHYPAWLAVPGNGRAGACISLDGLRATGGTLKIRDNTVTPAVQLVLQHIEAGALRQPGGDAEVMEVAVEARLGARGTISIEAQLRHPAGRHPDLFSMTARNVDLQALSPYARRIFGRDVVAGLGNATLLQQRHNATLRFDNHLGFDQLTLNDDADGATDDTLVPDLALALATDTTGHSAFSIQGSLGDSPERSVVSVFTDSLAARFDTLAARPFRVLAEVAGKPDAVLDEIAFLPGSAEMAPAATDTLALLVNALRRRPRLGIDVWPAYDLVADRDAIAAQQVKLHIALATSATARDRGNAAAPDFSDARVRDVLDEFAAARLTETQRQSISRSARDDSTRYRDIYFALVANERVSETVLRRLARFRARSVIDTLDRQGIDRNRFRIADTLDATATGAALVSVKLDVKARPAPIRGANPG